MSIYSLSICLIQVYQVSYVYPFPTDNFRSSERLPDSTETIGVVQFLRQEITKCTSTRMKRDSSGKFAEAAKTPMIKAVRQMLQLFRNSWAFEPVGGRHPLDPDVAYGAVYLFKTGLWDYFFPDDKFGDELDS